ncbi:cell wall metabolism sensor histidine kinase WalK [Conexibacter sp. DBS9H8]|uniref:sensor histidine kinase n=1 Tax=Conexibacter sp. DBS9H8 TaxID=2937801 RepID=UPI00200D1D06|nr:HAMP domain-containing sensor histidine kinase [Conexibacter sp. DBS9H8]
MAGPTRSGDTLTGPRHRVGPTLLRELIPRHGMPLRQRISLAAAAAVAIAVALSVIVSYSAVRYRLQGEIDSQLTTQAHYVLNGYALNQPIPGLPASAGGSAPYAQLVLANGEVFGSLHGLQLPGAARAAAVATGESGPYFANENVDGTEVRVYTFTVPGAVIDGVHVAVQLGRPLTQMHSLLSELRLILAVVFLLAVPLAAMFGRFAARRVLRPLAEVTATAEAIARTDDLSRRLEVREEDEVGQLASRFNAMLERLTASREEVNEAARSQRQLVADASHELRTPVTSLRTNVEVLLASPSLDESDRALLEDVLEQSEELSTLVADLIEVARGELPSESLEDIRLDLLVEEALVRARRNAPAIAFSATLTPAIVQGNPEMLSRAINNLLDNAAKHAGRGPVEVTADCGGVIVRDHGDGIAPGDLPYIFDRFYRGVNSRATLGSGLGLAIVRQTALLHGGSVTAENAPDGGAVFSLTLPGAAPGAEDGLVLEPGERAGPDGDGAPQADGLVTRA